MRVRGSDGQQRMVWVADARVCSMFYALSALRTLTIVVDAGLGRLKKAERSGSAKEQFVCSQATKNDGGVCAPQFARGCLETLCMKSYVVFCVRTAACPPRKRKEVEEYENEDDVE